jgi:hypothetical protein
MNQATGSELEIAYPPLLTFALRRLVVDVDPQAVAIRDLEDDPGFGHSSAEISPLETQREEGEAVVKRKRTLNPGLVCLWESHCSSRIRPTPAKPIQSIKSRRSTRRPLSSPSGW